MYKFFYWFLGVVILVSLALNEWQYYQNKVLLKNYNELVNQYNELVDKK